MKIRCIEMADNHVRFSFIRWKGYWWMSSNHTFATSTGFTPCDFDTVKFTMKLFDRASVTVTRIQEPNYSDDEIYSMKEHYLKKVKFMNIIKEKKEKYEMPSDPLLEYGVMKRMFRM